jgi:oxygen-dependent protoporphyrinogen oxidase
VVGAGISGLAYAHARGDADVLVLEASEVPGGCMRTGRIDDVHYEMGPEVLQDNSPATLAMFDELGLEVTPAPAVTARRYVLAEAPELVAPTARPSMDAVDAAALDVLARSAECSGRLVAIPTGPKDFLKSPLLSRWGKARALTEPFRRRAVALDGSVADFIRHRLGTEVLDWLVDPFISGIYAGDPELLSARATFPALIEMVSEHGSLMGGLKARARARKAAGEARPAPPSLMGVVGGLGEVPAAVGRVLGDRLRLGCPVSSLTRRGDGWRLVAGDEEFEAGRVILATPVGATAGILAQESPALCQTLGAMTAESVVSISHLWRRDDVAHPLDGFGYLVPSRLGMRHLGTLFSSSIQPSRCGADVVLLRTLLGGARHPELAELAADDLRALVGHEVGAVLGLSAEPIWSTVVVWRSVLPRYDLEHPARLARIETLLADLPGLHMLGNHQRGISVNALVTASRELAAAHA